MLMPGVPGGLLSPGDCFCCCCSCCCCCCLLRRAVRVLGVSADTPWRLCFLPGAVVFLAAACCAARCCCSSLAVIGSSPLPAAAVSASPASAAAAASAAAERGDPQAVDFDRRDCRGDSVTSLASLEGPLGPCSGCWKEPKGDGGGSCSSTHAAAATPADPGISSSSNS